MSEMPKTHIQRQRFKFEVGPATHLCLACKEAGIRIGQRRPSHSLSQSVTGAGRRRCSDEARGQEAGRVEDRRDSGSTRPDSGVGAHAHLGQHAHLQLLHIHRHHHLLHVCLAHYLNRRLQLLQVLDHLIQHRSLVRLQFVASRQFDSLARL